MEEAWLFMLIFGTILCLTGVYLYFCKDSRKTFLCSKVRGMKGYSVREVKTTSQKIGCGIGGVGLAMIIFFLVKLLESLF